MGSGGMKVAAVCIGLLSGSAAMADVVVTEADMNILIKVIEARGCVIRDKNDLTVIDDTGLTQEVVHEAVAAMLADGRAEIVNDELHLKTGACP